MQEKYKDLFKGRESAAPVETPMRNQKQVDEFFFKNEVRSSVNESVNSDLVNVRWN